MLQPDPGGGVVLRAWATGVAPDPIIASKEWIAQNLVVPDGPRMGDLYDFSLAPYMEGILDALDDELVNTVVVMKSAQIAYTLTAIGWVLSNIANAPAHDMLVQPTILGAQDFNRKKLQPVIAASRQLRRKVMKQVSRSSEGSTALVKMFPGGSLTITGANSAADLRSKTTKRQVRDEIDEYPLDLDGQGDPEEMMDARLIAFHATGEWKVLKGSTPTIKGGSKIETAFEAGDQRRWAVQCPHCSAEQVLRFGDKSSKYGLKFNSSYPFEAYYACKANGCVIDHHDKPAMVRKGKWVATAEGPGRYPSFHIDALVSLLTTWDEMAAAFVRAKDDPLKLKAFVNLWLGETWEERGEAPDWQKLILRREEYDRCTIPPGGLIITGGADVQLDGIYFEVVAWGIDKQNWSIDAGFIQGDTADIRSPVWRQLLDIVEKGYPDAWGRSWAPDRFGVDSGYNTNVVYEFCRRHPKLMATKGDDGWHKPAIASSPSHQQVTVKGKRKGVKLWHIGTWPLKAELYQNLRKDGLKDGAEATPPGYCHFTTDLHDEIFFRQLTAEHLKQETRAGRIVQRWVESGANHWLDCRIIARACADLMGLSRFTANEWQEVIASRGPADPKQRDIFAPALAGAEKPRRGAQTPARRVRKMVRR